MFEHKNNQIFVGSKPSILRRPFRDEPDQRLLCRVWQGGGRRCNQSQGMQVMYGRQVLQCQLSEESLAEAQESMQGTCR